MTRHLFVADYHLLGRMKFISYGFDGRGHLYDLRPYDADLNKNSLSQLNADELRIERLCEEERYLELHTDLAERAIQEEEELKRLNQELAAEDNGYQAVGFSYNQSAPSEETEEQKLTEEEEAEEEDTPFVPPAELALPRSMAHPEGNKLNAIIEKTAKFVSEHGGQMEIMIKTKQAGNPQFEFLNFEHHLNPYYKHQVYMIKNGRYNPEIHNKNLTASKSDKAEAQSDSDDDDDGYLHPSLFAPKPAISQAASTVKPALPAITQDQLASTAYGRLMKNLKDKLPRSNTSSPHQTASHSPSYYTANSTDSADAAYQQYYAQQQAYYGEGAYPPESYAQAGYYAAQTDDISQRSQEESRPASPPEDIKPLVERLLLYVKKDGEAFENQVLQRNDSRFSFLQSDSQYYSYYTWRKNQMLQELNSTGSSSPKKQAVSFSIKYKEAEPSAIDSNKAALPVDPESDEEEALKAQENQSGGQLPVGTGSSYSPSVGSPLISTDNSPKTEGGNNQQVLAATETDSGDMASQQQRRLAEQKLRDKLAAAMREKMTQVTSNTREKSLQAERKKKAAMFVNMLKSKKAAPGERFSAPIGPELPVEMLYSSEPYSLDYAHRSASDGTQSSRLSADKTSDSRDGRSSSSKHRREDRHRRRSPSPSSRHRKERHRLEGSSESSRHSSSHRTSSSHRSRHSENTREENSRDAVKRKEASTLDEDYMLEVRKKLKASRREVFREDLFGE